MNIYELTDPVFTHYGKVLTGYDTAALCRTLEEKTPLPAGTAYVPSEAALEELPIKKALQDNAFGGVPIQMGWCNGHNTKLNCLEYHRSSEFNLGSRDFILLLARLDEVENGVLDTAKVRAFRVPAGVLVEVYATTLHYAPCSAARDAGFRVLVALPKGTNNPKPEIMALNEEDTYLWAANKWLLAHGESDEARQGARVALRGENIDIAASL
ncbi:MAG: DUF4867 family protein [Clostridiales bacterium]|nr:DUF4867 family protein [Clostridiales bacterium]